MAAAPRVPRSHATALPWRLRAPAQGKPAGLQPAAGIEGGSISALAIDPQSPETVFAATTRAGLFKSTDGGGSWHSLAIPVNATPIVSLAIAPADPQTVYAGTGRGVFKTTDGGATWRAANDGLFGKESAYEHEWRLSEGYVQALVVDPGDAETVYAGTYQRGLFKSTNGGASWAARQPGGGALADSRPERPRDDLCRGRRRRMERDDRHLQEYGRGQHLGCRRSAGQRGRPTRQRSDTARRRSAEFANALREQRRRSDQEHRTGGAPGTLPVRPAETSKCSPSIRWIRRPSTPARTAGSSRARTAVAPGPSSTRGGKRRDWNEVLVLDPSNPATLYAGTGEAAFSRARTRAEAGKSRPRA